MILSTHYNFLLAINVINKKYTFTILASFQYSFRRTSNHLMSLFDCISFGSRFVDFKPTLLRHTSSATPVLVCSYFIEYMVVSNVTDMETDIN